MLIEMKHIEKNYGPVQANKDVSIHLNKNEILAIVGENGAGKSTIMKILYGLEAPDGGAIYLNGQLQEIKSPLDAMKLGIGMVQQHFMFFGSMSVAENIVYNNEIARGLFFDYAKTNERVKALSLQYGLDIEPNDIIEDLPIGTQQKVEILKILYQESDIIIFDEPSAVLTPIEVEELLNTMCRLKEMGKSIILITHKLDEVMNVSDRVVVMRLGEVVYESLTKDTNVDDLTYNMVGRHIQSHPINPVEAKETILEVKDLTMFSGHGKKSLDNVDIKVRAGEIVGIAGVSGNGQSELVKAITGLMESHGGTVLIEGHDVTNRTVHEIRKTGLSHVPEDRYYWGSAANGTLIDNTFMGFEEDRDFNRHGILNTAKIRNFTDQLIKKFSVKTGSNKQKIKELSGGNAQKLIIAREFSQDSRLLIVNEPTRGVDIGAMEFIHHQLLAKRDEYRAILLVSSDLNEIMSLSDRIYVMFEGRINREFKRNEVDAKTLGLYMVKGREEL